MQGIPSFKGFYCSPNAAEKIKKFKGNLAKCAVVVTYGNRDYDDALIEFKNI